MCVYVRVCVVVPPVVEGMRGSVATPEDITTLRVKSDGGRQTLIIKLKYDDTIGDVRRFVDNHRCVLLLPACVLSCVCQCVCVLSVYARMYVCLYCCCVSCVCLCMCVRVCSVSGEEYVLRTAVPNRAYDDVTMTLREAGLIPTATLMVRPRTSS